MLRSSIRFHALVGALLFVLAGPLAACKVAPRSDSDSRAQRISEARKLAARGQAALKDNDLDGAIQFSQQALALNPDFGAAWNNLGLAFMRRGKDTDFIAAQQAFQSAASVLPSDPTPYRNLGILYQQRGFEDDALRNFENALGIDENDIESLRGATRSIMLLKKSDQMTLQRLKRAQMIETDKEWREIIIRERIRVENDIEERTKG
jgi:tetratricopeptide (TPR) repeat protein